MAPHGRRPRVSEIYRQHGATRNAVTYSCEGKTTARQTENEKDFTRRSQGKKRQA